MSKRASLRPRSKRKVKVNIPLTEQDLREYLDDGYTPARIAKEYGVSLTVISEKMQKLGARGRSKPRKVVKKRGRPVPPKKQKPKARPTKRRSSPRKRKDDNEKQGEPSKHDLNSVVTQVIEDNPKETDNIHALLDFMGFTVEKSFVEDQLQKWKSSPKKGQKPSNLDDVAGKDGESSQEKEEGTEGTSEKKDDTNQATTSEVDGVTATQPTEDGSPKKQTETSVTDDEKVADTCQEGDVTLETKEGDRTDGSVDKDEPLKPERGKKRGRVRQRKTGNIEPLKTKPAKRARRSTRKTEKKDEDAATGDSGEDDPTKDDDPSTDWSEGATSKKPSHPKTVTKTKEDQLSKGKGRPRLNLTKENLQHCIDSGLTTEKIAEVFGAGVQSVKRYLKIHKMRKKDRVSKISDEELDEMVLEMCKAHPEWGQVHIQEELKRKGFFLCRAQVRGSVRRVDPVGIEVRRLKNLKMRWNRGSINKLDKILPEDGINMTSTESFISKPPRNGLNALNDEESVRILTSVVASSKKTYIEPRSREGLQPSKKPEDKDVSLDTKEEQSGEKEEQSGTKEEQSGEKEEQSGEKEEQSGEKEDHGKEFQGELVMAAQEVDNANEVMREETGNKENIGTDRNQQQDPRPLSGEISEEEDEEENYRRRFYNMIFSYEKCRKESAPETNASPLVDIPKEEMEQCVNLGFSTARIAEKFDTTKSNVIRHMHIHKLGKASRFENLSDEALDHTVMDLINEFSIRKGSDVYSYAKKKGYQIRRKDINKSLSRLFPKGLHRKSSSILQESWDAAFKPHPSDVGCTTTQYQGQVVEMGIGGEALVMECSALQDQTGNSGVAVECTTSQGHVQAVQTATGGETVVVLNSEELAQLIHGEGNIVIEYEGGDQVAEYGTTEQIVSEIGGNQVIQVEATQQPSQKLFVVADETQEVEHK